MQKEIFFGAIMKITLADIESFLKKRFSITEFRHGQFDIILDVLVGRDVCACLPTGYGKSLIYQSMAVLTKSVVVVVEPYISLIRDQVAEAKALGIPATSFHSDMTGQEQNEFVFDMKHHKLRLLFVTPERFGSAEFMEFLLGINVGRIIIDEAHCVLSMGDGFRPAYRAMTDAISQFNQQRKLNGQDRASLTFLSATLSNDDIFQLSELFSVPEVKRHIIRANRNNIKIGIEKMSNEQKITRLLELLRDKDNAGASLVYVSCKQTAKLLYDRLKLRELKVGIHHASLSSQERASVLEWFKTSKHGVLITTSALSAGFNKPDIRNVIHYHPPRTIEDYVQEIGRAGRDGLSAQAICLNDVIADKKLNESLVKSSSPDASLIAGFAFFVADKMHEQHSIRITTDKLKLEYGLREINAGSLRTLLSHAKSAGALDFVEDKGVFDITFFDRLSHEKLLSLISGNAQMTKRFNAMLGLLDYGGCKHEFLASYFEKKPIATEAYNCDCCFKTTSSLSGSLLSDNQIRHKLIQLRQKRAKGFGVPAFMLIPAAALDLIVKLKPQGIEDLLSIAGMDEDRVRFIGQDILGVLHGN